MATVSSALARRRAALPQRPDRRAARDGEAAEAALREHISRAFETRLRIDSGELRTR